MNRTLAILIGVLLCTSAIARNKEKKDDITYNGDGTYSCSGSSAACAQINQQRNAMREQRDRERQREWDRKFDAVLRKDRPRTY